MHCILTRERALHIFFFFSSRRRHTRFDCDWSSDVCSSDLVFAATTHGLTIYDRQTRTWRLPVTSLEGYPAARVRVALADGVGDAVWLGTAEGWARYDAGVRTWEQGAVPGGVASLMLDARDQASGIFVQGAFGWGFLPRGALFPVQDRPLPPQGQRVTPLDPRRALAQAPFAEDRKSTRLNSSHSQISYAVFCLKKKKKESK